MNKLKSILLLFLFQLLGAARDKKSVLDRLSSRIYEQPSRVIEIISRTARGNTKHNSIFEEVETKINSICPGKKFKKVSSEEAGSFDLIKSQNGEYLITGNIKIDEDNNVEVEFPIAEEDLNPEIELASLEVALSGKNEVLLIKILGNFSIVISNNGSLLPFSYQPDSSAFRTKITEEPLEEQIGRENSLQNTINKGLNQNQAYLEGLLEGGKIDKALKIIQWAINNKTIICDGLNDEGLYSILKTAYDNQGEELFEEICKNAKCLFFGEYIMLKRNTDPVSVAHYYCTKYEFLNAKPNEHFTLKEKIEIFLNTENKKRIFYEFAEVNNIFEKLNKLMEDKNYEGYETCRDQGETFKLVELIESGNYEEAKKLEAYTLLKDPFWSIGEMREQFSKKEGLFKRFIEMRKTD